MAHTIDNIFQFKALTLLQSHYDLIAGTNYSDPAPEADPNSDCPFIDNGKPLHERFKTRREELLAKWDYLVKISS